MKIKINITIDVDTKSFAACYGEDHIKEIHEKTSVEDAQLCCEQALNDWFNIIGFEGKILKAQAQPVTDVGNGWHRVNVYGTSPSNAETILKRN